MPFEYCKLGRQIFGFPVKKKKEIAKLGCSDEAFNVQYKGIKQFVKYSL